MKNSKMFLLAAMIAVVSNLSIAEENKILFLFEDIKPALGLIFEQDSLPQNSFGGGIEKNTPKNIIIIKEFNVFCEASPAPEVLLAIINQLADGSRILDDSKNEENSNDELRKELNK